MTIVIVFAEVFSNVTFTISILMTILSVNEIFRHLSCLYMWALAIYILLINCSNTLIYRQKNNKTDLQQDERNLFHKQTK